MGLLKRTPTLGVDPRLVLVLEFHSAVDPDEIHRNDMVLLDGSDKSAVVAFVDDPALTVFHERLSTYRGDIPEGQKSARFQSFFDSVVSIRAYGPQDRISPSLAGHLAQLTETEQLRLDVRCWHPDRRSLATAWLAECRSAAETAGGQVVTVYQNDPIGLLIARVFLPSDRLTEFAQLDVIASIDRLPTTDLSVADFHSLSVDQLPEMAPPAQNAPILGLIDSGVASAHPLIAGTVLAAETLSPHIADGEDRHGHGTMVASLALHGPIPAAIQQPRLVPIAKIVSVAVLDGNAAFPDDSLWESDLASAIEYCADMGARVINLSLGDPTRPYVPPRQSAVAAIVDHLARLRDLVIVVSTGNADLTSYLGTDHADPTRAYVADLFNNPKNGIIPPGTAALAITVGGISTAAAAGGYASREPAERRPYGRPGWPSTVTRRGPGIEGSTKPELVASSGTHCYEPGRLVTDTETAVIAASAIQPGRLLRADIGTSYSAPLVSHIALGVLARYPYFSANLVRALTLLGAEPTWDGADLVGSERSLSENKRRDAVRTLIGYGESTLDRTLAVNGHRAVLVAQSEIAMDAVHVYELPIPSSFYQSGGSRDIDIAIAFDPPTKSQRLDYLGNKIAYYLVRGIEAEELLSVFAKTAAEESLDNGDPPPDSESDEYDPEDEDESAAPRQRSGLKELLGGRLIEMDSAVTERSRSTNQLGRKTFRHRWDSSAKGSTYLVVKSLNRWCDSAWLQRYAVAVSLRRELEQPEIYSELAAQLEAVVEVEVEVEVE